ncbi:MAG: tryptophan--tRNA ligase [Oligoflexia bacterium]
MTAVAQKQVMLSAVQPSSGLTLGNYIGALRNWVRFQRDYECWFFAVNLHAITVRQDPKELVEQTYRAVATYLAAGIDPEHATLFIQSQVPQHAELAWLLNCYCYMGELGRMTQFKDKSQKAGENIPVGLFTYPVLMAADILLYDTQWVPVGADQKQHIELTRDIAIRMNNTYGDDLFKVPQPLIPPVGARIMSLQDPTSKMSKSDPDPHASVFLFDSDDLIRKKIKRAVTDSGSEITDEDSKPGVKNLLNIQSAITGTPIASLVTQYAGKQYGHLKVETAEIVVQAIGPLRKEAERLYHDRTHLEQILQKGAERARQKAAKTLERAYCRVGLL